MVSGRLELRPSTNEYDWLGPGLYWWQDDPQRALHWAKQNTGRGRIKNPTVLGAVIEPGNSFTTARLSSAELLHRAYLRLLGATQVAKSPMPVNSGRGWANRRLDCAVFNSLHELCVEENLPPFDTIIAYFPEGGVLYPGAAIRRMDHVQVCVRTDRSILGYFMPRAVTT